MIKQGFRGNCDSTGKLGMCPSLAEPDATIFPRIKQNDHNVFVDDSVIVLFQTPTPALDNSTEIQYNKRLYFSQIPVGIGEWNDNHYQE